MEILINILALIGTIAIVMIIGGYILYWGELKDMEIEDEHSDNTVG